MDDDDDDNDDDDDARDLHGDEVHVSDAESITSEPSLQIEEEPEMGEPSAASDTDTDTDADDDAIGNRYVLTYVLMFFFIN